MKISLPHFIIIFLVLSFSCKTTQKIPDLGTHTKEIVMVKNPCFGTCPVYTLTIYEKGYASFDGEKDTEKLGLHAKVLSKTEQENISNALTACNFFELDDDYPSQVSDLPKTAITYYKNNNSKTVTGDDLSRPASVLNLDKILTQIAESDGWIANGGSQNDD